MSRFSNEHPSSMLRGSSQWFAGTAKNKRVWLIVSVLLLALSAALLSSPTRALAGKRLLDQAWTTVASVIRPENLAGTITSKGKIPATVRNTAVALKTPILSTANLNIARQGHTATRLSIGKILIVGGENANGLIKESEIYDPATHRFLLADNLNAARTEHTATELLDGRILIVGGRGQAQPLRTTEIYDFRTNVFTAGPSLNRPRAGHSATTLADGRILIAGGHADGSAEIFDPAAQTFTILSGGLNTARSLHTSVLLKSGKVLLAGGKLSNGKALNSAELFDPATQQFSTLKFTMGGARISPALNLLRDGKVQVIGGGEETMEIYNAEGNYFTAYAHLPANDATLSTPGRAALIHRKNSKARAGSKAQTETFAQAATTETDPTDPLDRDAATTTDTSGGTLVVGGVDSTDTTLATAVEMVSYPASVTTDKSDYAPGETATITGSGFLPNQVVNLLLERDPPTPATTALTAQTDGAGNFSTTYLISETDLGVTFILTASQNDGPVAQTTFTDGLTINSFIVQNSTCAGGAIASANFNDTICANANVTITGGSKYRIQWYNSATVSAATLVYDDSGTGLTASATSSHQVNSTGTWTLLTCGTGNAGLCSPGNRGNITTITVGAAPTTTSISAPSITYNANGSVTVNVTSGAGTPTGNVSLSVDGGVATTQVLASGSSIFTLSGLSAGSHSLSANYAAQVGFGASSATGNIQVNPKPLTISGAVAQNKIYDGNTTATVSFGGATLSGVVGGDTVSINSGSYAATFNNKNVGTGKAVTVTGVTLSGASAGNYTVSQPTGLTANITVRTLTVTATGVNRVYDGTTNATVTLSDNRISGDVLTANYTSASFADKNVGSGKTVSVSGISISGTDAGNYTANTTASPTANITVRTLTVMATGVNRVYDSTTNATVTLSDNRISGDVLTANYTSASFADKNVGIGKTVSVSGISISGTDAGNYTLGSTTAGTTADITVRTVVPSLTANSKTYDGTASATIASRSLTGVIMPDVVSLTGGSATFADSNVGNGKTVTATGLSLNGADAGNYSLSSTSATTVADITVLGITGNFTVAGKTYDGLTTATVTNRSLSGVLLGDSGNVSLTGGTANFTDANVGTNKTVTLIGATLTGSAAGNYSLTSVAPTTANITKANATINVTGYTGVYDGAAHGATGTATGILNESLSGLNPGSSFTNVPGGLATWTFTDVTGNYNDASGSVAITITPATATISVTPYSVTYDGVAHTATGTATGVLSESLSGLNLSGTTHTNAGAFVSDTWTFTDVTGNYNNANGIISDNILKAGSISTVTVSNATYDANPHGGTAAVTGVGGLNQSLTVSYSGRNGTTYGPSTTAPIAAGDYTANASFGGDANHDGSNDSKDYSIARADSITAVTISNATYDGSSHGGTASGTGVGGLNQSLTVTYTGINGTTYAASTTAPTNAGDYSASATFAGDANHNSSSDSKNFIINKATSTTAVTVAGGVSFTYDGNAHPATVAVTGAGGLSLTPSPVYSCGHTPLDVADSGCTASYTFTGDANHTGSSDSKTYNISKAGSTTTVSVASVTYDGNPHGGTALATGVGGLNQNLTVMYTGTGSTSYGPSATAPTGVGTYTAAANFAGDANHTGSSDTKNFAINARPTVIHYTGAVTSYYGTCVVNVLATLKDGLTNAPINKPITITIAGVSVNLTSNTSGTVVIPNTVNVGSYNIVSTFGGDLANGYAGSSETLTNAFSITPGFVGPYNGQPLYTGLTFFWTTSSTSSTATLSLSATLKDTSSPCQGDIRTARVTFATRNGDGTYTPLPNAQNLPVGLVNPADPTVGTAQAVSQYNLNNLNFASIQVAVIITGNYQRNQTVDDTEVGIAKPGVANQMIGVGRLDNTAGPFASNGFLANAPAAGGNYLTSITSNVTYNKSFTNPQGKVSVLVKSFNKSDGTVDTTVHAYLITSNSITTLSQTVDPNTQQQLISFGAKCNVVEVTNPTVTVSLDGGAQMQVVMTPSNTTAPQAASVTIQKNKGGLWYSSAWDGGKTVQKALSGTIVVQ